MHTATSRRTSGNSASPRTSSRRTPRNPTPSPSSSCCRRRCSSRASSSPSQCTSSPRTFSRTWRHTRKFARLDTHRWILHKTTGVRSHERSFHVPIARTRSLIALAKRTVIELIWSTLMSLIRLRDRRFREIDAKGRHVHAVKECAKVLVEAREGLIEKLEMHHVGFEVGHCVAEFAECGFEGREWELYTGECCASRGGLRGAETGA